MSRKDTRRLHKAHNFLVGGLLAVAAFGAICGVGGRSCECDFKVTAKRHGQKGEEQGALEERGSYPAHSDEYIIRFMQMVATIIYGAREVVVPSVFRPQLSFRL